MENVNPYLIFGSIYLILLFFDTFLKSCLHYPYIRFLEEFNIKISFLSIKWKTKAFNRTLLKWGNSRPKLLKLWFYFGTFCSLLLLPFSVVILMYSIYQAMFAKSDINKTVAIEAVVPGINLPISEMGYYSVTLLICSVVHELGHSLAAVLEDVPLVDIGCNLYFILPIAYVNIATDKFFSINYKRRLSILCAGVWHNICLSFFFLCVYYSLPLLFSPLYITGKGVSISHVAKNSPLISTFKGLNVSDIIVRINDCDIRDEDAWYDCLNKEEFIKTAICIESDLIHSLDESVPLKHLSNGNIECCDGKDNKNLCFEYLDRGNGILELPSHACLPARSVLEKSNKFCTMEPNSCPDNSYCFKPILDNNTHLFNIVCSNKHVIYLGSVNDIRSTIDISPYINKTSTFSVRIPDTVAKLLKYIVVISFGLAFVNILPIAFMDGDHIFTVICLCTLKKRMGRKAALLVSSVVKWLFTIVLVSFLIHSVMKMI